MAEAKRFYWLKLKEDFFTKNLYVKKLRRMERGTELAFLYLELMTYSLEDNGILAFQGVEDTLAEELALNLNEDPDLMTTLIDFLIQKNLLVNQGEQEYLLVDVLEATGSETKQAEYNRIRRAKENKNNAGNGNEVFNNGNNVTESGNNVTECYQSDKHCFLEKEREKDKDIDIDKNIKIERDKEREIKDHSSRNVTSFIDYQSLLDLYHAKCPSLTKVYALTPERKRMLKTLISKYGLETIEKVFIKAQNTPLLKGEVEWKGHDKFIANLDWIINQEHFVSILEGAYDRRGQPMDSGTSYAAIEQQLMSN